MKTTAEMIEVMKAYDKGKKIEAFRYGYRDSKWFGCEPDWNWFDYDYRIKADNYERDCKKENVNVDIST